MTIASIGERFYRIAAMEIVIAVLASYLLGSISFAIVVSRAMRLPDPRSYGSKNPGATNVLRTGRKAAAVLTLAGDALKGLVAVLVAARYAPQAAPYAGLAAAAAKAAKASAVVDRLAPDSAEPVGSTPEEYAAYIASEQKRWGEVVRKANIKAN
jgi:hypothetical protein